MTEMICIVCPKGCHLKVDEENGYKVTGVGYGSGALAVQDMLNGNIDYVIIDSDPAKFIVDAINEVA